MSKRLSLQLKKDNPSVDIKRLHKPISSERLLVGGLGMSMFDSFKVIIASSIICCIALKLFGKDWKRVEDYIGTRTGAQIRSHA